MLRLVLTLGLCCLLSCSADDVVTDKPTELSPQDEQSIREAWRSGQLNERNLDNFLRQLQSDPNKDAGAVNRALYNSGNLSRELNEMSEMFRSDIWAPHTKAYFKEHGIPKGLGKLAWSMVESMPEVVAGARRAASGDFSNRPISDLASIAMLGFIGLIGVIIWVFAKNWENRITGATFAFVGALLGILTSGKDVILQLIATITWLAIWLPILFLIRWLIRRKRTCQTLPTVINFE
jgi:hypothetical protein